MPTVRSKLKDALDEELRKATALLNRCDTQNVKIAIEYVNAIRRLIDVCEKRKRY